MFRALAPCSGCQRHIAPADLHCPFCGRDRIDADLPVPLGAGGSRLRVSAVLAAAAAATAAPITLANCTTSVEAVAHGCAGPPTEPMSSCMTGDTMTASTCSVSCAITNQSCANDSYGNGSCSSYGDSS